MADTISRGIDISSHQQTVDFEKVKAAGYSYVIIKAGQGLRTMDSFRQRYLPQVLAAGMDWGAYWWSDAVTVAEAKQEASAFAKALDGLNPTYPVWMDQEYGSPCGTAWGVGKGRQLRTDMVKVFMGVMQTAGYYTGLYASTDWLNNWVFPDQLAPYDKWAAQYASRCTYGGAYGMWQHHGNDPGFIGRCDGISVPVDLNDCYRDYPSIIKGAGLNGWGKLDTPATPPPAIPEPPADKIYTLDAAAIKAQGYDHISIRL